MAKKSNEKIAPFQRSIKEALEKFDIKAFKSWLKKYNKPVWNSISKHGDEVVTATMCKMICNRTDMLGTEAHKKAVIWLKEHNMRGRLF